MYRSDGQLSCCRPLSLIRLVVIALFVHLSGGISSPLDSESVSKGPINNAAHAFKFNSVDEGLTHSTVSRRHLYHQNGNADVVKPRRLRRSGRMLSAGALAVVPQCYWDSELQGCEVDDAVNVMFAIRARPISAYLWFLLMTYDRETACGVHQTASACKADTANRCVYFDDILSVIGSKADSAAGNSSSSTSSQSNTADSPEQYLASLLMTEDSVGNSIPSAAAAVDHQADALRTRLREQLLQQQQHLIELIPQQQQQQQQGLGSRHQWLSQQRHTASGHVDYAVLAKAAPDKDSSTTSSTSSSSSKESSSSQAAAAAAPAQDSRPGGGPLCTSTDLLENYVFTKSAYSNPLQAPVALHCPGSRAHELVKCMRITGQAACKSQRACVFVAGSAAGRRADMCVSRYFNSLSPAQVKKFTADITMAEPAAVGSCDGACWMRQAMLCNRTTDIESCSALSFCRASPSGSCTPRLYSSDEFGSTVQEYMGECADVDNRRDCEGLRLRLISKGSYTRWQMPSSAIKRCSVPSIRGLLGASTEQGRQQQQQQGSRLIAAVGSMEERAAELQAAAAAAAAAANAAKLVSGRGPMILRQIYFHDRRP